MIKGVKDIAYGILGRLSQPHGAVVWVYDLPNEWSAVKRRPLCTVAELKRLADSATARPVCAVAKKKRKAMK